MNYFDINRLKVIITGVAIFFFLSFGIPNKIPVFCSGCVFTALIAYYGVKWYALKPLREIEKKKEREYKRVLNDVWKVTKSVLNKKPEGLKPNDMLPEVMKATGLRKKEIFYYWRTLEFHSKIAKKNSKYCLVPTYVRIFKEPIEWLVIFYMLVGACVYLLFIAWLIYIVVFEWIFHLPLIPWWFMIQQLFNGGPATICLYIFLGIGMSTYLMKYAIEHGWQPVKNFTRHFAKRAALITPQLSITLYILLVYFKVIMPLEPFSHAFFAFVESLGIFSIVFTLPVVWCGIWVILLSAISLILPDDDDVALKAPLLFVPKIMILSVISPVSGPGANVDFIRQLLHEKAMLKDMEKMMRMRSKI
jgi:hypothetical protein